MSAMGWKETRTASTIQSLLSERVMVPARWSAISQLVGLEWRECTIEVCEEDALGLCFQRLRERHNAITLGPGRVRMMQSSIRIAEGKK